VKVSYLEPKACPITAVGHGERVAVVALKDARKDRRRVGGIYQGGVITTRRVDIYTLNNPADVATDAFVSQLNRAGYTAVRLDSRDARSDPPARVILTGAVKRLWSKQLVEAVPLRTLNAEAALEVTLRDAATGEALWTAEIENPPIHSTHVHWTYTEGSVKENVSRALSDAVDAVLSHPEFQAALRKATAGP